MNPYSIADIVRLALAEDIGPGDLTTELTVPLDRQGRAVVKARCDLIVSGLEPAREVLRQMDPEVSFKPLVPDGLLIKKGAEIAELEGRAASILSAERVMLNFLMRLSGVATLTSEYVRTANNPRVTIIDTRKTTPGLRVLEKAAVRHGGGGNHRFALYDGILIKDNHIAAAGSITEAVENARRKASPVLKIEVEVDTLEQLEEALKTGAADIIMLDNMSLDMLRRAVARVEEFHKPGPRTTLLEASGGVNLDTIADIARTGVDLISVGALTHSAPSVDVGLDWS